MTRIAVQTSGLGERKRAIVLSHPDDIERGFNGCEVLVGTGIGPGATSIRVLPGVVFADNGDRQPINVAANIDSDYTVVANQAGDGSGAGAFAVPALPAAGQPAIFLAAHLVLRDDGTVRVVWTTTAGVAATSADAIPAFTAGTPSDVASKILALLPLRNNGGATELVPGRVINVGHDIRRFVLQVPQGSFGGGEAIGVAQAVLLAASGDVVMAGLPVLNERTTAILSVEEANLNDAGDIAALANGGQTIVNTESVCQVAGVKAPRQVTPVLTDATGRTVGVIITNAGGGGNAGASVRVLSFDTNFSH